LLHLSSPLDDATTATATAILQQDTFYPRLLTLSSRVGARLTILECGDPAQARRVAGMAMANHDLDRAEVETWRCDGSEGYVPGGAGGMWYGYGAGNSQRTSGGFPVWEEEEGDGNEEDEGVRAVVVKRLKAKGNNSGGEAEQ